MRTLRRLLARMLRPICRRICSLSQEYLSRLVLLDIVMGFIDDCKIEGCYLEFGCAGGGSLVDAFNAANRYRRLNSMPFFVFDSFEGLPEPAGLDAGESLRYNKGDFACNLDRYRQNVSSRGVDLARVTCVPGWYSETLNEELKQTLLIKRAAVVWIDCDLYESTVPVLEFITHFIQDGTVVIFDDWFSFKGRLDRGEARAFKEWLAKNSSIQATQYHMVGRTMMSFIMQVCKPAAMEPIVDQSARFTMPS
jgi:O-methyltransferase